MAPAPAPAVIDDDTPTPAARAPIPTGRLAAIVAAFAAIWAAAFATALALGTTYAAMAWLFTKAALVTFGGAYAVLPYIVQQAVEQQGWLTAAQMIDGPRARRDHAGTAHHGRRVRRLRRRVDPAALGTGAEVAAGIVGACVATFFTFLPSFLFILAGGPLVEATHGDARVTAPLTGITGRGRRRRREPRRVLRRARVLAAGIRGARRFDGLDGGRWRIFAASAVALSRSARA
jgi:chromate transporter